MCAQNNIKLPGAFCGLVEMRVEEHLWPPPGLSGIELEGASPWISLGKSNARRTDPSAIPGNGLPLLCTPIDDDVYFYATKIQKILDTGGITLGASYTNFLDTPEGEEYFEKNVVFMKLSPGQVLFVPWGWWLKLCSCEK